MIPYVSVTGALLLFHQIIMRTKGVTADNQSVTPPRHLYGIASVSAIGSDDIHKVHVSTHMVLA